MKPIRMGAIVQVRRLPAASLFIAFVLLCMSLAYWGMQMFRPAARPVAAPPVMRMDAPLEAAASLFGGRSGGVAVASNYQLKGIVMAADARDSAAIVGVDGRPATALRVGDEVAPGVKVKEVNKLYVILAEGGVGKRVDLPDYLRTSAGNAPVPGAYQPPPPQPNFQAPQQMPVEAVNPAVQPALPPGVPQPPQPVTTPQR